MIPTHNRPLYLARLLVSLQKYHVKEIDSVVIVDDSDSPARDLAKNYPDLNIRHIVLENRAFISKAKNIGWKSARTEYVFFIDDDNIVDDRTISPALSAIERSENTAAIMPAVLYASRPDLVWVYATPFGGRAPKFNLLGRNLPRDEKLEGKFYSTDALPNSSIIRRDALEKIGGLNERLVVNSSMDLALRLKARGWKVLAYTGCFIYHDVEPPGKLGWWATHGAADPDRVRYEILDWFIISGLVRGKESFHTLNSVVQSLRFVIPNALAYSVRGKSKRRALAELSRGYIEGILESRRS